MLGEGLIVQLLSLRGINRSITPCLPLLGGSDEPPSHKSVGGPSSIPVSPCWLTGLFLEFLLILFTFMSLATMLFKALLHFFAFCLNFQTEPFHFLDLLGCQNFFDAYMDVAS